MDLFDKEPIAVSRAGFGNEGKIHLGLVYAKDRSYRTVETMMRGAFHFADYLNRWIDFHDGTTGISTPFYYLVHRDSQLTAKEISEHFEKVQKSYLDIRECTELRYLYQEGSLIYREVSDRPETDLFDLGRVEKIFKTVERAVDPERIAEKLRRRLTDDASISFVDQAHVRAVKLHDKGGPVLEYLKDGLCSDSYDHVVNALWAGRLALDRTVYGLPKRRWIMRNKLGVVVRRSEATQGIPSITMVLGSYGDIVNYGDGSFYLSWYPDCMVRRSSRETIDGWEEHVGEDDAARIMDNTLKALTQYCPGTVILRDGGYRHLKGGTIFAWGETDIDDAESELHTRYDIGIYSRNRYHSVNTGKYTMAPLYAVELADRILGETRRN